MQFALDSERESNRSNIETLEKALHSTQQLFVGAEAELESLRATLAKLQLERQQLGSTENFELDEVSAFSSCLLIYFYIYFRLELRLITTNKS